MSAFLLGLKALAPLLEQLGEQALADPVVEQAIAALVARLLGQVSPAPK